MGTRPGFDEWVAARGQSLLRLAYLLTGSRDEAEDLVQDALSRVLPRWSRVASRQDPDARVHRAIVDAHIARQRQLRRRPTTRPKLVDSAGTTTRATADHDAVWQAFAALPVDQRTAMALHYYQDLDIAEIADLTGVRESTVRTQVSRGLAAVGAEVGESDD